MSAIGSEYGNAIFLLAKEEGILDEAAAALIEVKRLFSENPLYCDFLETPSLPISERLGAVRASLDGNVPDCVTDFICILTERGYIRAYDDCEKEFEDRYNEEFGIAVAEVTSAKALSVAERQELRDRLQEQTCKRIKLVCSVDPTLVGGLTVKIEGRLFDGSLRARINDLIGAMS
ncbi:MAG: ATP synthase F1 subunit delta [Clostridia bacterium]|nr:ATP synthase F1 subunit delta [Clostridia bacterium]